MNAIKNIPPIMIVCENEQEIEAYSDCECNLCHKRFVVEITPFDANELNCRNKDKNEKEDYVLEMIPVIPNFCPFCGATVKEAIFQ